MIEDCTHENGLMMVIPKSDRGPVFNHHENGMFAGGICTKALGGLVDMAVDCIALAGYISIHHVRTLHASKNNLTDSIRPLLLFSHMAVDAFPVFERHDIEEFNSRIIRARQPCSVAWKSCPFGFRSRVLKELIQSMMTSRIHPAT